MCGVFAGMTLRSRRAVVWYAAILPTRKIFCLLAFFHMAKQSRFPGENAFARVEQTCANRDDKIAPRHQKAFREISKWRGRIISRTANQDRHRVFPFQTRDFAKPAPGETSQSKTQIPDRFRIDSISVDLMAFSAGLGWRFTANE